SELGSELAGLDPSGRFLLSATAPQLPVWHTAQPQLLRASPFRAETPGPGGELILPIAEGRWLLWNAGQLRLWRSIGEAWRKPLGEPGSRAVTAQLVLDGRLFVLAQQRPPRAGEQFGELRLSVAATSDGAPHTQLRLPQVSHFAIAARRGFAAVRSGDRVGVFDLRFGRWIRDLVLPPGITELAIDAGLQRVALGSATGLELVRPDALASSQQVEEPQLDTEAEAAPTNGHAQAGERSPPTTNPPWCRRPARPISSSRPRPRRSKRFTSHSPTHRSSGSIPSRSPRTRHRVRSRSRSTCGSS
ncbi:MAG: hypothetical protein ABI678_24335, partial [Kofleriaceae bacterium]